jgi:hypothetical protein
MATPEQRIKRELSERGTCSFLDLKAAVKLSRGDIEGITARLTSRGIVKIKKDLDDKHTFYTWAGPKEEARPAKQAPPKKTRKSRTIPTVGKPKKTPARILDPDWREQLEREVTDKIPRDHLGEAVKLLARNGIGTATLAVLSAGGNYELVADALWICVQVMTDNPPEPSRKEIEIFERLLTNPWISRMYQIKPTRERDNIRALLLHPDRYNFPKRHRGNPTNIRMYLLLAQLPHLFYKSLKKPVHGATCAFIRAATGGKITEKNIHTLFDRYGIDYKKPLIRKLNPSV